MTTHLRGLCLADPDFDVPATIDVVLKADVYGMLLDDGFKRGQPGDPTTHLMAFGWVFMGSIDQPVDAASASRITVHHA